MRHCKANRLPTSRDPLGMDPEGIAFEGPWSYPSIVEMLLYLTTNTRPDIAFAVSQVVRFTYAPKQTLFAWSKE